MKTVSNLRVFVEYLFLNEQVQASFDDVLKAGQERERCTRRSRGKERHRRRDQERDDDEQSDGIDYLLSGAEAWLTKS